jgi:uncharacterized protein YqeY
MSMLDLISKDMQVALKAGEKTKLETLRMIRASLLEKQVEKRPSGGMTPEDEVQVLISSAKKRKESIEVYRANGRNDLADQEALDLEIVQSYLPKQLSEEEIRHCIQTIISQTGAAGARDFSKVMPAAMKELKGKADGKIVQNLVKSLLGE